LEMWETMDEAIADIAAAFPTLSDPVNPAP
jgi:hypothetical protein